MDIGYYLKILGTLKWNVPKFRSSDSQMSQQLSWFECSGEDSGAAIKNRKEQIEKR